MDLIFAPVSAGELFDKISILMIKSERITDPAKLANVRKELDLLSAIAEKQTVSDPAALALVMKELKAVNEAIWEAEDVVRAHERSGRFGEDFVRTARTTYGNNDKRAALKREINRLLNSMLIEEKSHAGSKV